MKATFFIDFVDKHGRFQVPFGQKGYEAEKIRKIVSMGMEIGNHTLGHVNMKKTGVREGKNSLDYLDYIIGLIEPEYRVRSFAYPYGAVTGSKKEIAEIENRFDCACMAWGGVAPDIGSGKFDRYMIPRIEIDNDMKNLERYVLRSRG
jgi:peptidoglycan/xylan/chitin deacetylase (PgdA/CDA1 family)